MDSLAARCGCLATRHPLKLNCLGCGNIICEREWTGICPNPACSRKVDISTKYISPSEEHFSTSNRDTITNDSAAKYRRAVEEKDKLLMKDRGVSNNGEAYSGQTLFDDQSDYYSSTQWLTEDEKIDHQYRLDARQEFLSRRSSRPMTMSIDIANRQLTTADEDPLLEEEIERANEQARLRARSGFGPPAAPALTSASTTATSTNGSTYAVDMGSSAGSRANTGSECSGTDWDIFTSGYYPDIGGKNGKNNNNGESNESTGLTAISPGANGSGIASSGQGGGGGVYRNATLTGPWASFYADLRQRMESGQHDGDGGGDGDQDNDENTDQGEAE